MREVLFDPFTEETGIEVELRTQGGMMGMLSQLVAQKDRLDADLWVSGMVPTMLAEQEGILADFPINEMSNVAPMPDNLAGENHVALWNIFYGLVYNSDAVPFEITAWEDLKDDRLTRSISIPHGSGYGGKFILLQAWLGGGDEQNIEPAFENLEELLPNVALVSTSDPDSIKFLTSGETDVATMMPVGNFLKIRESGDQYKFVAPEPYVPANFNNFTLLDGPNSEAAIEFVNFALAPERQTALSERLLVLPANPKAKVPEALAPYAPSPDKLRFGDEVAMGEAVADWASRWDAAIQN
ncbi:extracellular solute-binding protein [Salinihabitans flavidus]|nr:extracellular solute-binding protein [Salinihabitans flavidus]